MTPTRSLIVSWLALLFVHQLAYTQTPDAKPQSLRIRDIRVEGNETASASAIIAYSNLRIGDVIGAGSEAFPKAIKNLMDRRLFSDVKIYVEDMRGDEGVIVISVKEYGRVGVVTFQGNDEFSEKDLESVVTIRTGDIASPYEIDRSRSKIRAKYGEEGYLFTKVKVETTPSDDDDGRSNLQFNIEEGPEVSIGAITIEGNAKIPDDALKIDNCLRIPKGCGLPVGNIQIVDQFGNPADWTVRQDTGVLGSARTVARSSSRTIATWRSSEVSTAG